QTCAERRRGHQPAQAVPQRGQLIRQGDVRVKQRIADQPGAWIEVVAGEHSVLSAKLPLVRGDLLSRQLGDPLDIAHRQCTSKDLVASGLVVTMPGRWEKQLHYPMLAARSVNCNRRPRTAVSQFEISTRFCRGRAVGVFFM